MKKAILILLTIFLTSGIWSCRSVKKDKSNLTEIVKSEETKKEVETVKEETNAKKSEEVAIDSKTATKTTKTTTRPIDATKLAIATDKKGNKTILENAELIEEESETNNNTLFNSNTLEELKQQILQERRLEEEKALLAKLEAEQLHVKRSFPILWVIIGAVAVFFLLGWLYQHNKVSIVSWFKKIWWV